MSPTKQEQQVQTGVRLPESWLVRLDKLAERMRQPGMRVPRSEALRLAVHRGLIALEAEQDQLEREQKKRAGTR